MSVKKAVVVDPALIGNELTVEKDEAIFDSDNSVEKSSDDYKNSKGFSSDYDPFDEFSSSEKPPLPETIDLLKVVKIGEEYSLDVDNLIKVSELIFILKHLKNVTLPELVNREIN